MSRSVRTTTTALGFLAAAVLAVPALAAAPKPSVPGPTPGPAPISAAELGGTPNVHRRGDFWFAGQPGEVDFDAIRAAGIRTVLSQRAPGETPFDEAGRCTSLGLHHERIGFRAPEELTDELLDRTRRFLLLAPRPILMHCGSANRTAATWIAWRTLDEGADFDAALAEARRLGLRTEAYVDAVRSYVDRRTAERAAAEAAGGMIVTDHERWALEAALEDERRAEAYYRAVIERHGARPPFTNLAPAEGRHANMAARAMERLGLEVPAAGEIEVAAPDTFEEAVRLALVAEEENIALFDRILPLARHDAVKATFARLRDRSLTRHLPALQRALARPGEAGPGAGRGRGGAGRGGSGRGG